MRTVSFSDREVQNILDEQFVSTFKNTTGDPSAGMSISHRPNDRPGSCLRGNGKQNVQTIFLTPESDVFHAATGFLSREDLLGEIKFAKQLFDKLEETGLEGKSEIIVSAHEQRLVDAGFSNEEIQDHSPLASMRMMTKQFNNPSFRGFGPGSFGMGGNSNGAGKRNGGFGVQGNPLAMFSRTQFLDDNKFSIRNPQLTYESFERDPTVLVGTGKSFFASSSSSN